MPLLARCLDTGETLGEMSLINIHPVLLHHLGFQGISAWVHHLVGHPDESEQQRLGPNLFNLSSQYLIKNIINKITSNMVRLTCHIGLTHVF